MILLAAAIVIFAAAAGLYVALMREARSVKADLERAIDREETLELRRISLEETYAERERMWAEERRSLLDRIQDPHAVQMKRLEQEVAVVQESDGQVDAAYAKSGQAAVPWDDDLAPIPGVDPEPGGD